MAYLIDNDDECVIREFIPTDYNYIISTWLRELRNNDASPLGEEWFTAHREFINKVLGKQGVSVKVLCPSDDLNEILSYIVVVPDKAIIWIHTKRAFRKMGLATKLIGATCQTPRPLLAFKTNLGLVLKGQLSPHKVRVLLSSL